MDQQRKDLLEVLSGAEKVLTDIGGGWRSRDDGRDVRPRSLGDPVQKELREAHAVLWNLIRDKDYYVATTVTDGTVHDADFDSGRVVVPCGNIHWKQCSKVCTKDIWEEGRVPGDICPHCRAPLTGNTVEVGTCIEEGYLSGRGVYKKWQTGTLNRRLVILELGEGFKTSTVIRRPFEKIGFFNQKLVSYRIHKIFPQMPKETGERAVGIQANLAALTRGLAGIQMIIKTNCLYHVTMLKY